MNHARINLAAGRLARELDVNRGRAVAAIRAALAQLVAAELRDIQSPPVVATPNPPMSPGSYVKIPFMSKTTDGLPLRHAIGWASNEMEISHFKTVRLMTYFLQAIVAQVDYGQVVRIPGFGIFGPHLSIDKKTGALVVYPRFVPSRAFRREVKESCPADAARNRELETYRRSHNLSSGRDRNSSMTHTTMEAWRKVLNSQDK